MNKGLGKALVVLGSVLLIAAVVGLFSLPMDKTLHVDDNWTFNKSGDIYSNISMPTNITFLADAIVFTDGNLTIIWEEPQDAFFLGFEYMIWNISNKTFIYKLNDASGVT